MIVLIDNYDSFVYNLSRYVGLCGQPRQVFRNDEISVEELERIDPTHLILSPGPCTPNEAGICMEAILHFAPRIPILGVCLGHQAIGQAFGGKIVRSVQPRHGKTCSITHKGEGIFSSLPSPQEVACYYSLKVDDESLPSCLEVTARNGEGEVMGLQHRDFFTFGVQFHPESVLTDCGQAIIQNFVLCGDYKGVK